MPQDKMGHELAVGDRVVYLRPRYHDLVWGTIEGFTPKMVLIKVSYRNYGLPDKRISNEVILDTRGWTRPHN